MNSGNNINSDVYPDIPQTGKDKENMDYDPIGTTDISLFDFDPLKNKKNISVGSDLLFEVFKPEEYVGIKNIEPMDVSMDYNDDELPLSSYKEKSRESDVKDGIPLPEFPTPGGYEGESIRNKEDLKKVEMGNSNATNGKEDHFIGVKKCSSVDVTSVRSSNFSEFHSLSSEEPYGTVTSRMDTGIVENKSSFVFGSEAASSKTLNELDLFVDTTHAKSTLKEQKQGMETNSGGNYEKDLLAIVGFYENILKKASETFLKSKTEFEESLSSYEKEKSRILDELHSAEDSFSKLHARYEKVRLASIEFSENQKKLLSNQECLKENLEHSERRYEDLRLESERKVSGLSRELEELSSSSKGEIEILQKTLELDQLKISNLSKSLEDKEQQLQELTKICDELLVNPKST